MKNLILACVILACVGCGCKHLELALQPGEKVIFIRSASADTFRVLSGNDLSRTGKVVEITVPTSLLPKR